MMKHICTVFLMIFTAFSCEAQKKPNIVILFVDDYGWSDVGYRNPIFHTPHINELKKEGLEFTRAYVSTPACSPSRASLLTGKEAVRMEMPRHISGGSEKEYNFWPKDPAQMPSRNWLKLEEVTYAEKLKSFGYYNIFIGKWHLGHEPYYPIHQGFDEQFGVTNASHPKNYYPPYFNVKHHTNNFSKEYGSNEGYLTDVLTDKAVSFIENYDKEKPFVLSFWYYNVHSPIIGRKDWLKKYKKEGLEGQYAEYAAMVSATDESVGRVRKALEVKGIANNTIVLLISDQGGRFTNAPLKGGKLGGNTLGEGGARVPFLMYYPNLTKANSVYDVPIQTIDVYPTLVEIASRKPCNEQQVNGKSILPLIHGETLENRDLFFYRSYEDQYAAVINDDWKLIKYRSGLHELFNVKEDISERHNLINKKIEIAEVLKKKLSNWEKEAVKQY